jgi:hypothetical protein
MLSNWKTYSYICTIVSRSFQTSHSESGLNNSIRLGYCLAYISTTFEMSISMSLWTYNKSRALKRSSPIVLWKEFFINRISSTLYSLTSINCVVTVRGVADCRHLTDGRTDEGTNGRTDGRTSSVRATGVKTSLHDVKLYNVLEIRFIKNSFRSTMGEDRFNALLLLYVHKDIDNIQGGCYCLIHFPSDLFEIILRQ